MAGAGCCRREQGRWHLKERFQMSAGVKHNAGQVPQVGVPLVLMGVRCIKSLGNRLLLLKE